MKSNKFLLVIAVVLFLVIIAMLGYLIMTPARVITTGTMGTTTSSVNSATTTATASSSAPLSAQVSVTSPASGASVERTFTVTGVAPNAWYFEAVFPIQVRDGDDNLIASGQGQAQSDWTTPGPVRFTATITITRTYSGPANLILLRDNPSGLPENFDEVTIPIIII